MLWRPAQGLGFALVEARERRRLPGGAETLAADPGDRYVTSVVRVHEHLSLVRSEVIGALPGVAGHYLYPRGDLHLTVLNLDAARQPRVEDRVQAADGALATESPFPVVLAGLGMSRRSVYARAYDPTGSLFRLRARLARATGARPPLPLRLLGFVNLLRIALANGSTPA